MGIVEAIYQRYGNLDLVDKVCVVDSIRHLHMINTPLTEYYRKE